MSSFSNLLGWFRHMCMLGMGAMFLMTKTVYGKERLFLVKDGKTDYSIYVNRADSLALRAAKIVQRYTKESTGQELSIRSGQASGNAIIIKRIDNDRSSDQTVNYTLYVEGENLHIRGEGLGVVYAAYRYVREIIGGRKWYTGTENTWIPMRRELPVNMDFYLSARPSFRFREVYFPVELDREYLDWYGLHNLEELWGLWGHTFDKILPAELYFKSYPTYYAYYQGRRQPIQLCLSNEAVFEHTVRFFKEKIQENPRATYWSIAPNDAIGYCTCGLCKAKNEYDGGPQGALIHFVNRVATRFPEQKFSTLAYSQTANAPTHTRVADNVYVILSNAEAFRGKEICREPSAENFRKQLSDWQAKSKHVFVWDYLTQFTSYLAPFPIQGTMQPNLHYLQSRNV